MKTWTPVDRLRPVRRTRIDYAGGKYIVRQCGVRLDPAITAGERRFDHLLEQAAVASVWFVGIPALGMAFYWALFEGSKLVYSFAFNHPFGR